MEFLAIVLLVIIWITGLFVFLTMSRYLATEKENRQNYQSIMKELSRISLQINPAEKAAGQDGGVGKL